mmetsp:Transcript_9754/g.26006  ORF Transcript_9754/g.26006 Transcript_9754/m.26006 type:complete len:155 (+) Transcript_9754:83-547(+)|eukprot:CAMPEP_0185832752 /NCGR_PEP_ID=MMETSP1353-20130828/2268_1 /TAXON_ID=1077150 /ORGANISM="Erythrolobus australicus, Strain CCMP3124" /LENGTH=154 /DNA_ID=CAMNT_0028530967 /DNA_START=63 /DNA_END=527 /DNA_ORIENTATION=+
MAGSVCFASAAGVAGGAGFGASAMGCGRVAKRCAWMPPTTGCAERRCRIARSAPRMGLFGLGVPELLVIAGIGVLLFGPQKLADSGKSLGSLAGTMKKATSEFQEAMQESLDEADREIQKKKNEKITLSADDVQDVTPKKTLVTESSDNVDSKK